MGALVTLAGLAWDPEIRGILVVATGFAVLMGSIWLIMATNSGVRLATLLATAALMGWMVILGSAWWMYGSGWKGDDPSWKTVDINVGDLHAAEFRRDTQCLRTRGGLKRRGGRCRVRHAAHGRR